MALKIVAETPLNEKHSGDVLSLACDENTVFSGGDDCIIKAWDRELKSCHVLGTLGGAVMALCACGGKIWAAGIGGELRHWPAKDRPSIQMPSGDGEEIGVLLWKDGTLYTGDDQGNVNCYVNNKLTLRYNMLEEVKDLLLDENRMYTVRDLDVTVTEFFADSTRYMTLASFQGRAPMRLFGDLVLVVDRTGRNISIFRNSKAEKFPSLGEVQASDMILTSLCVTEDGSVWSGGWDGCIRMWRRSGDTLQQRGDLNVGKCINAIVAGGGSRVYAAIEGGNIIAVESL